MNNKVCLSPKLRTFCTLWLMLFCFCSVTFAQSITVTGKVLDSNKEALIGVSVLEKGTTNGTITDFDGNFTLSVPTGATLQFSYIGFTTKEMKAEANMVVEMAEDTNTLDEVVVVG